MREDVARFIARHQRTPQQEVEDDVAPYRGASLEERLLALELVCRSSTSVLAVNPCWPAILRAVDPPHPTYREIMRRLRKRYPPRPPSPGAE